ncbi:MAG: DUF4331 domain-containing protein [Thiohalomonadales bacterium]
MKIVYKTLSRSASAKAITVGLLLFNGSLFASSHMDAPLITLDDAANTTDVYAFKSYENNTAYLTTALSVYPFEEPGIGPNKFNFDDNVRYEIHVALGDDVAMGRPTITYRFDFSTRYKNQRTILQSFLGRIENIDDKNQNLTQTYRVTKIDHRNYHKSLLGQGIVPPNNQGLTTPYYNQDDSGENPAKDGVAISTDLDRYTQQAIAELEYGHRAFAGQRDDGFYADIQSIFDLDFTFAGPNKPFDSQAGFNVHTIVLNIPLTELGGSQQMVGVYATTSRRQVSILSSNLKKRGDFILGRFVQVGRQGNPLFNEGFVSIADQDLYNRSQPSRDRKLFEQYALRPELARVLVPLLNLPANLTSDRTDIAGIYIPDLIKLDLSTEPARLAGGGSIDIDPLNPDDSGFSRLSVFGGDTLVSSIQAGLPGFPIGTIAGGWPNGRRFGDDVVDIAVTAAISDLRGDPLIINGPGGDNVDANDIGYNKVFPYAATPLNGRNHKHH